MSTYSQNAGVEELTLKFRPSEGVLRSPRSANSNDDVSCVVPGNVGVDVAHRRDERMVGGNKAEAAGLNLRTGSIYMIRNKVNGKKYVGQTIQRVIDRVRKHRSQGETNYCRVLKAAILKHGWDSFEWSVLEAGVPASQMDAREIAMIDEHESRVPSGYNLQGGGNARGEWSAESKELHKVAVQQWAGSLESRQRKSDIWNDVEFRDRSCEQRKSTQNTLENVQSRQRTWDAKRMQKLESIECPEQRAKFWQICRSQAKQGASRAIRRGAYERDPTKEFHARWGTEEEWKQWVKDGLTRRTSWMPFCKSQAHGQM